MFEFEIVDKLPSLYNDILEFQTFGEIEEDLFSDAVTKGDNFIANNYISTMLDAGLTRLEKFLDIVNTADMTVDERREQIYALWNSYLPLTYSYFIQTLNRLVGEDNYTAYPDFTNYALTVVMTDGNVDTVVNLCELVMPMNIDWLIYFEIPREFDTDEYIVGTYIRTLVKSYEISYSRDRTFDTRHLYAYATHQRESIRNYDVAYSREIEISDIQYMAPVIEKNICRSFT